MASVAESAAGRSGRRVPGARRRRRFRRSSGAGRAGRRRRRGRAHRGGAGVEVLERGGGGATWGVVLDVAVAQGGDASSQVRFGGSGGASPTDVARWATRAASSRRSRRAGGSDARRSWWRRTRRRGEAGGVVSGDEDDGPVTNRPAPQAAPLRRDRPSRRPRCPTPPPTPAAQQYGDVRALAAAAAFLEHDARRLQRQRRTAVIGARRSAWARSKPRKATHSTERPRP